MKSNVFGVLALTLVLGISGCGGDDSPAASSDNGASFPVMVSTPSGIVTIDEKPDQIVSLAPTATEMLYELGAGEQVKAVDELSNYPTEAPKSDLSGYTPNLEAIVAQAPDLVLVSNDTNGIVAALRERRIPTLLLPAAGTLDETYGQLTQIGKATGHSVRADELVSEMKASIAELTAEVPKRAEPLTYYYELDSTYFSVTSRSFVGSVLGLAGLRNIADASSPDNAYPQLSSEAIVAADPDVILLADTKCCAQTKNTVAQRPGWANIAAVKDDRVVLLDDDVASRWGPRVVDLLRQVVDATKTV